MHLARLTLANFRSYRSLDLELPGGTVVVSGANAQGKSSLLEAVYVLATTRSPYAGAERELVSWAAQEEVLPFCRVAGEVLRGDGRTRLELVWVRQAEAGEERYAKQVRVNGVARRALDALGRLNVVLFTPRDLELVAGPPAERRRYLDVLLCQVDEAYCRALARYNRVLAQRNQLLRRLRDLGGDRSELAFWDAELAASGGQIVARRSAAVARLGELAGAFHDELAGAPEPLEVRYLPKLDEAGVAAAGQELLVAAFGGSLALRREEEIARGMTLTGPHRDDLAFQVRGVDMRTYGSRGQQRTVTLALKRAEAALMRAETGEAPVLLLDEVLSELDARRQACLLAAIDAAQQTLLTTTEPDNPALARLDGALRLQVVAGELRPDPG
jgi:DNA replication and repair protein RecF